MKKVSPRITRQEGAIARDATSTLLDHGLEAPIRSPKVSEYPINTPGRRETLF
jgi:hypothetical protein